MGGVAEDGPCKPLHPSLLPRSLVLLVPNNLLDPWKAGPSKKPSSFDCLACPSHWLHVPGPCLSTAKFLQEDTLQQNKHCDREPEITALLFQAIPASS